MKINQNIIDILKKGYFEENKYFLPEIKLDRKDYLDCNNVLTNLGLIWNKKTKAHITDEDSEWLQDTLNEILDIWEVQTIKDIRNKYQAFYTPESIASRMVDLLDIREDNKILEPSAWIWNIVKVLLDEYVKEFKLFVNEIDPVKIKELENIDWITWQIMNKDFLDFIPVMKYDRVILNPPFNKWQDIKHILKAYSLLKDWWILVWLVPSNFLEKYKDKLENIPYSYYEVDDWLFEFTNIKTIIIKINK